MKKGNLVLYKHCAALITAVSDKIEIQFADGKGRKVRPKDIQLLHEGPITNLSSLGPMEGEVEEAWEMLQGEVVSIVDVAELVYAEATPQTVWATWLLTEERLRFLYKGDVNEIEVATAEKVQETLDKIHAKETAMAAWEGYLANVKAGTVTEADTNNLFDLKQHALGLVKKSRTLQALKKDQFAETSHALLLKLKVWDETVNPYPQRADLPTESSQLPLPQLDKSEERLDLTHLKAYAIDDVGNTDPDDAISIDGDYIWIHVADAAALVQPGEELDLEAANRGANQYLPEKIVTMLPVEAVHQLGLGLSETSPALSFGIQIDESGELSKARVERTWVKVDRVTYADVDLRLDEPDFAELLRLTSFYRQRRVANGAPVIRLPEVSLKVKEGKVLIRRMEDLVSRRMVTDAMLMAGEAAARFALNNEIPIPFATQQCNSRNSDVDDAEEVDPSDLATMFSSRKRFKRSQMKTVAEPHAGLGMDLYTRTTSPLRRYPDLIVHQQLRAFITGKEVMTEDEVLQRVGIYESVAGSISRSERSSNEHWKMVYLIQNPDWTGEGIVVDEYNGRYTVLIPELGLEVKMKLGTLPLNSRVNLACNSVDLPMLSAYFRTL